MLQIYIDDSGKEKDSASQVLAGYLAPTEQWEKFSTEWASILKNSDLNSFHMVDAFRMSKNYQRIGAFARNQLISDLLVCINRYVSHAFVLSIDMFAYRHWMARDELPDVRLTRPYFFGFHSLLTIISDHLYQFRDDDDAMIFFDEQGGESAKHTLSAVEALRNIAKNEGREHMRIPMPRFISDDQAPPLQAADMLAWLCRRENHNYRTGEDYASKAEHIWLNGALSVPHTVKLLGEKELKAIAQDLARKLEQALETKDI